ncbi:MAG: FtsX-like permease family protein [Bryobacterales bacterium]|nr:FtsX-like permease family protein [Bryobacterales bacterium]
MASFRLLYRFVIRPMARERLRTVLTVFAVALGVGVVIAIELAGQAAAGSFHASMETLAGRADYEVTAAGGVPVEAVGRLATLAWPIRVRPRIEDYGMIAGDLRVVPVIGVDLVADGRLAAAGGEAPDAESLMAADAIWAGPDTGYHKGDTVRLILNDTERRFRVRGVLGSAAGGAFVLDLGSASRLLGRKSTVDRILIESPASESVLRAVLPPGCELARFGARTEENRRMLAAFRWNLRVLSYIALVVGAFLIYNTLSVSVVRRRPEIGIVRAMGATRRAVLGAVLSEAAMLGLAGGAAGLLLGRVMAEGAVRLVAATVDSLYVSSRPAPIEVTAAIVAWAMAIGIGAALVSALTPAWEAAQVPPTEAMARGRREYQARVRRWRNLGLGAACGLAAWLAARQAPVGGRPLFGYLAALLLIATGVLAIPALISSLASVSAGCLRRIGAEALLAGRSLAGSLRRTSVLVGALSTAVAMTVAVAIMVGSFRQTVLDWMDDRLKADLYLRPAAPASADRHPTIRAELADRVAKLEGVAAIDRFRAYEINYQGMPATLAGGDSRVASRFGRRSFLGVSNPVPIFRALEHPGTAVVSEPFANKHNVHPGDRLRLPMGARIVSLKVLGVFYDYANERGYIIVDRRTLLRYLPDPASSNIAVYLKPGVDLEAGRRQVEGALAGARVQVLSNRRLRQEAIRIFDRTFAITYALEAVAILVAVTGVASALVALVIDRRRELGLLRFLGGSRPQVARMIYYEAGLLGLLANGVGLLLGMALSMVLIFVINRQSFGWTIRFHWPVAVLLGVLTLIYMATVLAAVYPARIATRLRPIEVVHEE